VIRGADGSIHPHPSGNSFGSRLAAVRPMKTRFGPMLSTAAVVVAAGCGVDPALAVTPTAASVPSGASVKFAVVTTGIEGGVHWFVGSNGGFSDATVDASGTFTAGKLSGDVKVVATSRTSPAVVGTSTVHVYDDLVDHGAPVLAAPRVFTCWTNIYEGPERLSRCKAR
jgi:hypothetical protein